MSAETTDDTEITLGSLIKSRAATYQQLARLYRIEVDRELLDELAAMHFPTNTGDGDVDAGYRMICMYLSTAWENTLTELAVDYTRTFIGHGINAYSAAYPFESVYTSPKRLLMQGARDEVLAIYRAAGIDKADNWKEGEDHIALELEFEQILCERAAQALSKGDEDRAENLLLQQRNFLEDHLLNWVPMFIADIGRFSQTDFYRGLAKLTMGFLNTDREFLQNVLDEEKDED
jgi:TorA maturation chaperone TorD